MNRLKNFKSKANALQYFENRSLDSHGSGQPTDAKHRFDDAGW